MYVEFGNLIPWKFCFWKEMFAILRGHLSFIIRLIILDHRIRTHSAMHNVVYPITCWDHSKWSRIIIKSDYRWKFCPFLTKLSKNVSKFTFFPQPWPCHFTTSSDHGGFDTFYSDCFRIREWDWHMQQITRVQQRGNMYYPYLLQ